ncbi:hypothetical protein Q7C36_002944 [Tachysurus vachellii]|uniref:E-selectin n=1 Tax=Tachysurus vachellii TaxID=175792 RepID=A0AA88T8V1_TACVA|nr:hypothetical protein Q7C36_002944 [Tachysurus vachellii]
MAGGLVLLVSLYAQTHLLLSISLTSVFVMSWTYTYSSEVMTWTEAKAWCENRSSWMMVIPNEEHNNYLKDNLPQKPKIYYWIGLRKTQDIWTWQGTAQMLENGGSWANNEPNNKKQDEDCVEIYINNGTQNGKWNDEKCSKKKRALCYGASCSEKSCSRNAECVEEINNYTCKCNPGFTGPMCMDAVTCNPPVSPQKGNLTCINPVGNFSYRSSCAVSCEEGYTLRGQNTLTCLKTGNWSAETPSCEVIRCNALGSVHRGSMHCTDLLEKFAYGSICQFECDVGFLLMGSNHTHCGSEGKWTHNPPVCQAVTCDQIVTPTNSHMTCTDPLGNFSYRSSCAVSCEEGYTLRGQNTLTCLKTGNWSAETPSCEVVQCPPIATVLTNGRINCNHPLNSNSYNSTCVFMCEEGFELRGSYTTLCDHTGQWTHDTPNCTGMLCKALTVPDGGIVNCYRGNSTICTVQCPSAYLLIGAHEYTCRPDGSWSQFQPLCASYKHMLMASSGCAVLSTICCCMFCCSYCRKRKKSVKQNDQEVMTPVYDADNAPLEEPLSSV